MVFVIFKNIIWEGDANLLVANLKNIFFFFRNEGIFGLFICIFFSTFAYYLFSIITIYLFTPTLLIMTDILSPIIIWILDTIVYTIVKDNRKSITQSILKFIGYTFLIIACLILNEIIICNFCNMNYNTQQQIEERAIKDIKQSINSNNESIISEYMDMDK